MKFIFPNKDIFTTTGTHTEYNFESESETARVGLQVLSCPVSSNPHNLTFHWFFNSTPEFKAGKY
jgi:hypothetical protein